MVETVGLIQLRVLYIDKPEQVGVVPLRTFPAKGTVYRSHGKELVPVDIRCVDIDHGTEAVPFRLVSGDARQESREGNGMRGADLRRLDEIGTQFHAAPEGSGGEHRLFIGVPVAQADVGIDPEEVGGRDNIVRVSGDLIVDIKILLDSRVEL